MTKLILSRLSSSCYFLLRPLSSSLMGGACGCPSIIGFVLMLNEREIVEVKSENGTQQFQIRSQIGKDYRIGRQTCNSNPIEIVISALRHRALRILCRASKGSAQAPVSGRKVQLYIPEKFSIGSIIPRVGRGRVKLRFRKTLVGRAG